MGKDGGGGGNASEAAERMATQFFDETQPLRTNLVGNYMNFLGAPTPGGATALGPAAPAPAPGSNQQYEDLVSQLAGLNRRNASMSEKQRDTQGLRDTSALEQQIREIELSRMGLAPESSQYYDSGVAQDGAPADAQPAYDVTRNPVWGAGRGVIEDQYDIARQNALGNLPSGGALVESLADIEQSRAKSLGSLSANIAQDEYNKLYGMATGAPGQAMGTMSSLAGQEAMAAAQEQAGKSGAFGDLGLGAGMFFGGK